MKTDRITIIRNTEPHLSQTDLMLPSLQRLKDFPFTWLWPLCKIALCHLIFTCLCTTVGPQLQEVSVSCRLCSLVQIITQNMWKWFGEKQNHQRKHYRFVLCSADEIVPKMRTHRPETNLRWHSSTTTPTMGLRGYKAFTSHSYITFVSTHPWPATAPTLSEVTG